MITIEKKSKRQISNLQESLRLSQNSTESHIGNLESQLAITTEELRISQEKLIKYQKIIDIELHIESLQREIENKEKFLSSQDSQITDLNSIINELKTKLGEFKEQDFLLSFGFYESQYNFDDSIQYQQRLESLQSSIKQMIKDKSAVQSDSDWVIEGDRKKGKRMMDLYHKLLLRAFNRECELAVMKVTHNNIKAIETKIKKVFEDLNKLVEFSNSRITNAYLNLRLAELYLTYEYQEKKQEEIEEQRHIKRQMREEAKALKEIEKSQREAEKEAERYQKALEAARKDLESASTDQKELFEQKIAELTQQLADAEQEKARAISRAQLTKSGHVYIISNVGSFGENIYKIGMTRRLDPMERVKELGDASVPFPFDVHAMIFTQNAPALETALHHAFYEQRVNKVNNRKEFFRVSLDEIQEELRRISEEDPSLESSFKILKIAEAEQYWKSLVQEQVRT